MPRIKTNWSSEMKAVILAGGMGTRISEETALRPKPMVEIGGKPILWHILKIYSAHGINDFVICLGYKGYMIKEYFANYFLHTSDVTFDMANNKMEVHSAHTEPWKVTLVDTGDETMTGGRLKRIQPYLGHDDFCFTLLMATALATSIFANSLPSIIHTASLLPLLPPSHLDDLAPCD